MEGGGGARRAERPKAEGTEKGRVTLSRWRGRQRPNVNCRLQNVIFRLHVTGCYPFHGTTTESASGTASIRTSPVGDSCTSPSTS